MELSLFYCLYDTLLFFLPLMSCKLKDVIYAVGDFFFVVGNEDKALVWLGGKGGNHL